MKLLADVGVSSSTTIQSLRADDFDVVSLPEEGCERLPDPEIVERALREGRAVITFDLDFGDLLAASRRPLPSVVILRLRNQTPAAFTPLLRKALEQYRHELAAGAIVIVEETRCRLRRLPIER